MPYSTPEKLFHYKTENREKLLKRLRLSAYKRRQKANAYIAEHREISRKASKDWRLAHPEIHRAHKAVQNAIKSGKLIRPNHCPKCGLICKPHAHHHNGYIGEARLDVIWLCSMCHGITRRTA